LKDLIATAAVGFSATLAQLALPADPLTWGTIADKLGVIGVLCVALFVVLRQWGLEKKEWKELAIDKAAEYRQELAKKDAKIEVLEGRLDDAQGQINDLRRHVLHITPPDIDSTATVRRSTLKLKEQQENA
jgi:hypothetical protein